LKFSACVVFIIIITIIIIIIILFTTLLPILNAAIHEMLLNFYKKAGRQIIQVPSLLTGSEIKEK
jgi:hypothetical protein